MDNNLTFPPLHEAAVQLQELLAKVCKDCGPALEEAVQCCCDALKKGNKILFFGNGGSATQAQHLAAELINRFLLDRKPLAALALTADSAVTTSISNDYAFSELFVRQLEGLGRAGDIAVALSTSGTSENIVKGLQCARALGLQSIGLLGRDGGNCLNLCDIALLVPSSNTARIQEIHLLLGHLLCGLVEKNMAARHEKH
ncbi:MAG: SIS domain-containing protein [Deltaproteobacteria bacterium]|nr:SIS domain-containing protein [Deltaproteobacteria bacterium]